MLICKTWNVVKPRALLSSPPLGTQQSQDSSLILSMVLQVLHSQLAVTHSQGSVREVRSKARDPYSALSLIQQDYLSFLTMVVVLG